jgi:hypothetical protein
VVFLGFFKVGESYFFHEVVVLFFPQKISMVGGQLIQQVNHFRAAFIGENHVDKAFKVLKAALYYGITEPTLDESLLLREVNAIFLKNK